MNRSANKPAALGYARFRNTHANMANIREVAVRLVFVDINRPTWLVVEPFDLSSHITRMLAKHPNWSDRQARCVLYWQNGVNKRLAKACQEFVCGKDLVYTICPEAMGVDVIHTAGNAGLPIRPLPVDWVFKIGLVGSPAEVESNEF